MATRHLADLPTCFPASFTHTPPPSGASTGMTVTEPREASPDEVTCQQVWRRRGAGSLAAKQAGGPPAPGGALSAGECSVDGRSHWGRRSRGPAL